MNYNWNWLIFFQPSPEGGGTYLDLLLSGLWWTIAASLASFALAFVIGSVVGVARTTPWAAVRVLGASFVEIFRNVPLLVQMFLWFFVFPELLPKAAGTWVKQLQYAPFYTTVLCLAFYAGARIAEQVRAGIQSMAAGQSGAGFALGLTRFQVYRFVLLPQAYRRIIPPLTSEFLNNVKNTSVGLTIGLLELTARARSIQEYSFQVFEAFTAATVLYIAINAIVVVVAHRLEVRLNPGRRTSQPRSAAHV